MNQNNMKFPAIQPVQIGNVRVEVPVALGPMAGVTDLPFRQLCREQGAGFVCSEMVSAKAILYRNKNTALLMQTTEEEHPFAVQLFGSEPDTVAEAAAQIEELPFDIFDFNMGCPVPKVVNNREGSSLMRDPELAASIIKAVVSRVKKPVTVKIRSGFSEQEKNAVEVAKRLEDAGAAAITVHGRTREQFYSGKADWEIIGEVKAALEIPVFGNGDVKSPESAAELLRQTGCDGIMIARAAEGNPWIFAQVTKYLLTGERIARPTAEEVCGMILRHARMLLDYKGDYTGIRELRKHVSWYTAGWRNSSALRREINTIESYEELEILVNGLLQQFPHSAE